MKNFFLVGQLILLLFGLIPLVALGQSVRGKIVEEHTSKTISGVTVAVEGTAFEETTDAEGNFAFWDIPIRGEYVLKILKNGFFTRRFPVTFSEENKDLGMIFLEPDLSEIQQQLATVHLSETELDEEDGTASNISGLLQASRDVFLNAAAFDFSPTFFRPRGYDSEWSKVFINGIEMNKFFNGRPLWSNWGGLNDVQRNQVFSMYNTPAEVSFGSLAGTTNIIMRASQYATGGKVSYAVANRAYTGRIMGSYHSGLMESGWAYSVSAARRFANESFIDGSLYDANSLFVSVEKKFNPDHSLNFSGFYTPVRRGKNSPNTQEVYELQGNGYNSYWGLQDGEIRNSRVAKIQEPVITLNHFWQISDRVELNSNLAYQFGRMGSSRIDYGGSRRYVSASGEEVFIGGGSNPDPAYYQKMPSFFLRFEDDQDYQSAYFAGSEFSENGQIDWNALYSANQTTTVAGGNALYVLYEDRNDDQNFTANTILRAQLTPHLVFNSAVNFRSLRSENFAAVLDLLGAQDYLDVDSFSEGTEAQNDLLNPNRLVQEGDKFKYNYQLMAQSLNSFVQLQGMYNKMEFYGALEGSLSQYQRNGLFKNGNFPDNSFGPGEQLEFENFGIKTGGTYKFTGRHLFTANLTGFSKAPSLRNSFSNARQNNEVVEGLESERVIAGDLNYIFRMPVFRGRITGFAGDFGDGTEVSFYYADGLSGLGRNSTTAFVQEVLTDIQKRHLGLEFGLETQVTQTLKLKSAGSIGEYIYANNPSLYLTSDDFTEAQHYGEANLKNYHLPGGPQTAVQVGFEYRDPDYWWFSATANHFANAYLDVAPLSRTRNFVLDSDGLPLVNYDEQIAKRLLQQEKFDPYTLVNLVGGKSWRIKDYFVGFFGSINNAFNSEYKSGGYEQSRNANYQLLKEDFEREQPLFAPKYWFGTGTTYYSHVYFRF